MFGRWLASALALAGCGRLGFDGAPSADAAPSDTRVPPPGCSTAHDEDADGIDDCGDVCPHIADAAQLDTDGDGVGDMCDPHISDPRDRIVMWEPLTSPPQGWLVAPASPTGDAVDVDARDSLWYVVTPIVPSDDTFAIGGTVDALDGNPQHQIALILSDYPRTYYCELYRDGGSSLNFTYTFDSSVYTNVQVTPTADLSAGQRYRLVMHRAADAVACADTLDGADSAAGGPPPPIDATRVLVQLYQLEAHLDYFIAIHSD